jgi:hypothetical protein
VSGQTAEQPALDAKAAAIETEIIRGLLDSLSVAVLAYHPQPDSLRTFTVGCRVAAGLPPEGDL